jgi:hypothetical protein
VDINFASPTLLQLGKFSLAKQELAAKEKRLKAIAENRA